MLAWLQERIADRLPKGRVARSIVTLASGTAMAQVVTICVMPVVTRLYTPAQIGVISLFLAFFGFWAATLSLRYEYALLIAADDAESHFVHRLAMMLVVAMSVLGLPVLWILHRSGILGFGLLPGWAAYVAVPILLGYGWFMVYRSWALRAGIVKQITTASIARSAATAISRVVLGCFGGGVPALFAAQFAGSWAAQLKLARVTHNQFANSQPAQFKARSLRRVACKFAKFPLFETPSAWIDQLGLTLPVPMIATLSGAAAAGWFGLARMMVGIPNAQIGAAVADVFQMELARAIVEGDASRARTLFYKMLRKLALVGLFPLIGVMLLGPWFVPWVFGRQWAQAGYAAAAIAPWLYAALVVSPLSRTLSVLQAQEYKLVYDVSAVVLLAVAFFVSQAHHAGFLRAVIAISIAELAGYVIYAIVLVGVVESRLRQDAA